MATVESFSDLHNWSSVIPIKSGCHKHPQKWPFLTPQLLQPWSRSPTAPRWIMAVASCLISLLLTLHIRELSSCWKCGSFTQVLGAHRVEVEGHFCHQSSIVSPFNPNFLMPFQFLTPLAAHFLIWTRYNFSSIRNILFEKDLTTYIISYFAFLQHEHWWSVQWLASHSCLWTLTIGKTHSGIFQIK